MWLKIIDKRYGRKHVLLLLGPRASTDGLARGDVLKSAQCYKHETGASEEEAHAHVQQMICDTWDEMNYETKMARTSSLLSRCFVEAAVNLARMSQCMYQYGDGSWIS
uniref:Terpene synthase metal-binding domain-containing protein n=1 Tax=Brassica oleracea var. oleracea TaxID=109376 RepID=A0A0D3DAV9_BRAOL